MYIHPLKAELTEYVRYRIFKADKQKNSFYNC